MYETINARTLTQHQNNFFTDSYVWLAQLNLTQSRHVLYVGAWLHPPMGDRRSKKKWTVRPFFKKDDVKFASNSDLLPDSRWPATWPSWKQYASRKCYRIPTFSCKVKTRQFHDFFHVSWYAMRHPCIVLSLPYVVHWQRFIELFLPILQFIIHSFNFYRLTLDLCWFL